MSVLSSVSFLYQSCCDYSRSCLKGDVSKLTFINTLYEDDIGHCAVRCRNHIDLIINIAVNIFACNVVQINTTEIRQRFLYRCDVAVTCVCVIGIVLPKVLNIYRAIKLKEMSPEESQKAPLELNLNRFVHDSLCDYIVIQVISMIEKVVFDAGLSMMGYGLANMILPKLPSWVCFFIPTTYGDHCYRVFPPKLILGCVVVFVATVIHYMMETRILSLVRKNQPLINILRARGLSPDQQLLELKPLSSCI